MSNFVKEIEWLHTQLKGGLITREKAIEKSKALLKRHGLPQDLNLLHNLLRLEMKRRKANGGYLHR